MKAAIETPFVAANEIMAHTMDATRSDAASSSQTTLISGIAVPTLSSHSETTENPDNEKAGRTNTDSAPEAVSRTSDVSTPATVHPNPFDMDVEAMITYTTTGNTSKHNDVNGRRSVGCRYLGESQVWPGQSHWKRRAKELKMSQSRSCLSQLSKRNRFIFNVLIVLLIIGAAVGIGLGISKPLGAAIWGQHHS
ncbi:hypothetical protein SEPCBS119000_002495 [Sporothrix epigloea]|uniref:Uncharacterized protein n=1 Tax=Sporothrix epigloea TaxID=1892477 RepID=A0ABP0DGG7_9PEZI